MDVFAFLNAFEQSESMPQRQEDMLIKDGVYYVFYRCETQPDAQFMMSVSVDDWDVPQIVRLFFAKEEGISANSAAVLASQTLAAFAGITAEESANAIALLRGENDDSFYSFERKEAQIDGHILQRTSTPLLAVYDFSVSYPSVQGEE